ncbi:MAG TPA: hypothetical protein VFZ83_15225 [Acidimicrobiia bacterium]|nr:hypothetical protein [Acidimicrobiia bacterium]
MEQHLRPAPAPPGTGAATSTADIGPPDDLAGGLPASVGETILRRLETLGPETQRILAAGSVLGRSFGTDLLVAITGLDRAVVEAALAEALAAEVLAPAGPGTYLFTHALVQATLYGNIGATRRARFHRIAAEALEATSTTDPPLAAIAYHYFCALPGCDRERAVEFARRAGSEAAARLADEQAIEHFERARVAATADGSCILEPADEAALLLDLGRARLRTGAVAAARATYSDAVTAARAAKDPVLLAHAAIGLGGGPDVSVGFELATADPELLDALTEALATLPADALALRAVVTARLAGARHDAHDAAAARALSAEALELGRASGDAQAHAITLAARHGALWSPDTLDERLALDDELLECARQVDAPLALQAHLWRLADLLESGQLARADAEMAALADGSMGHDQPRYWWYATLYRAMRALLDGRIADAADAAEQAHALGARLGARNNGASHALQTFFTAREQGRLAGVPELLDALAGRYPAQLAWVASAAMARVEVGDLDGARRQLEFLAADDFRGLPRTGMWLPTMVGLADVVHALGATREAAALYDLLLPFRDRYVMVSRILVCLGSVEHALGVLATTLGRLDDADAHFARARERHEAYGAPLLVARTELARAGVLDARGDHEGARTTRDEIAALAIEHGWTALLARARPSS